MSLRTILYMLSGYGLIFDEVKNSKAVWTISMRTSLRCWQQLKLSNSISTKRPRYFPHRERIWHSRTSLVFSRLNYPSCRRLDDLTKLAVDENARWILRFSLGMQRNYLERDQPARIKIQRQPIEENFGRHFERLESNWICHGLVDHHVQHQNSATSVLRQASGQSVISLSHTHTHEIDFVLVLPWKAGRSSAAA